MKTIKFLSMAALALVGAVMTGCSSDDNIIDTPQQPANNGKTVTLTMSVGLNVGGDTRALAPNGTKTFAAGEKMAVIYKKTGGATAMAETEALKDDGDITNSGKTATFTVTHDDPDKDENVTYVYPAAMVNNDGSVKNDALAQQDGTLASLGSNLDYCTNSGAWDNGALPELTLENQFAICAYTLKNSLGTEITSSITSMTITDGTNTYAVTRSAAAGPIYVAIRPTSEANITITAAAGSNNYDTKELTGKTYAAGTGYSIPLRLAGYDQRVTLGSSSVEVPAGACCLIEGNGTATIAIGNGAEVTLSGMTTSGAINCSGNATIVLDDETTNTLTAGIHPGGSNGGGGTLVIKGTGTLDVSSSNSAVIGTSSTNGCGDIEIQGGIITASSNVGAAIGTKSAGGRCGNITISGGTITATSTCANCPAIGAAVNSACGNITITDGVTSVTATKGSGDNTDCIGKSYEYASSCGTVQIGNITGAITKSPYTYDPNAPADNNTVIWGVSEFSGIGIYGDGSVVKEGITLTVTMGAVIDQGGPLMFDLYEPAKFSAPDGKIFTKIEITTADTEYKPSGTGWDNGVWTGNAAEVQVGGQFMATSITFTLADPTLLEITVTDPYSSGAGTQKFYYFDGETFGQAITNHATENAAWQVIDTEVCYKGHAISCGGSKVSKDAVIDGSLTYTFW